MTDMTQIDDQEEFYVIKSQTHEENPVFIFSDWRVETDDEEKETLEKINEIINRSRHKNKLFIVTSPWGYGLEQEAPNVNGSVRRHFREKELPELLPPNITWSDQTPINFKRL